MMAIESPVADQLLERPYWRGRSNVDVLTIAALLDAEDLLKHEFTITQGSYNTSVGASAGTHAGGGALDLAWTGYAPDLEALRLAGFAAWHRTPDQGPWRHHIHAVLVDHPALSPAAARQVEDYRNGRNGLANRAPDDGPRFDSIPTWRDYMIILTDSEDLDQIADAVWSSRDQRANMTRSRLLRRAAHSLTATRNHGKRTRAVLRRKFNATDADIAEILAAVTDDLMDDEDADS